MRYVEFGIPSCPLPPQPQHWTVALTISEHDPSIPAEIAAAAFIGPVNVAVTLGPRSNLTVHELPET